MLGLPESRKYPSVDYIVKSTVGKRVDGKSPKQVSKVRVLDPACGSGSFLIGAYQYLLNWYRDAYVTDGPQKHKNEIVRDQVGNWRLTLGEKKKILVRHIYGVDIDSQAVEVTKLSLLLKVLEGESQLKLFHERALPDLGKNIKCGNSLIGSDFYENQQLFLLDDDDRYRINVFDWKQAFQDAMKDGGFDVVIGNPPYIRIQALKRWSPVEADFFNRRYAAAGDGSYDIYVVFIERGLSLLNPDGHLGFILPSKFFVTDYGNPIRKLITSKSCLSSIVDFRHEQVFREALNKSTF
jgi:type I restriction-modification system DNA methylase subunit